MDVLRQAVTEVDDMDFELAVELRDAVRELILEAKTAEAAYDSEMLEQVEAAPRKVGSKVFMAVDRRVERVQHDDIAAAAIRKAVEFADGDATVAARTAVHLVMTTYVSPSTKAKKGAIERSLDLDPKKVIHSKKEGRRLHEVDEQGA